MSHGMCNVMMYVCNRLDDQDSIDSVVDDVPTVVVSTDRFSNR
jgi:hypothetical protein